MIQRQQRHAPGTFAVCGNCKREPVHVVQTGAQCGQVVDFRDPNWTATRHVIECCRCGRSTGPHITVDDAISAWGEAYAQQEFKLRVVQKKRAA